MIMGAALENKIHGERVNEDLASIPNHPLLMVAYLKPHKGGKTVPNRDTVEYRCLLNARDPSC